LRGACSLLVEAPSAASIEAQARALISASSRGGAGSRLSPSIATRIERPDGSFKDLDPERAVQLHRYRYGGGA
jgi:hypothetical protein